MKSISLMLFLVLFLAGCSSLPPSLELSQEQELLSYEMASAQPDEADGKMVRWGGVIAEVTNMPDATMLEMVYYPIRSYGRPIISDESMGRYRVYVDGFLDPMVFQRGRSMTFLGQYIGTEAGMVGEHEYVFPTIKASGHHIWKEIDQVEVSTITIWPYGAFYGWPLRSPYYHQRVIIRRNNSGGGSYVPDTSVDSPRRDTIKPSHVTQPRPPKDYEK